MQDALEHLRELIEERCAATRGKPRQKQRPKASRPRSRQERLVPQCHDAACVKRDLRLGLGICKAFKEPAFQWRDGRECWGLKRSDG